MYVLTAYKLTNVHYLYILMCPNGIGILFISFVNKELNCVKVCLLIEPARRTLIWY